MSDGRPAALSQSTLTLALADSRARFRDLVELSGDYVWETDRAGRFSWLSSRGILGWTVDEALGKRPHELGLVALDSLTTPFMAQHPVHNTLLWLRERDGAERCLSASALPLFDAEGAWAGARGLCRDLGEQRQTELALASARTREKLVGHIVHILRDELSPEREFDSAARALTHAMSAAGCVLLQRQDTTWQIMAGYGVEAPPALMTLADAVLERDGPLDLSGVSNHWLISRTQHRRVINGAVAVWRSADKPEWTEDDSLLIEAVAGQFGVVVAQLATKQQLLERAERDGLTKLYNQRAFLDLLEKRLAKHGSGVLVNIDLDNFKCINDTLGHQTGDKVLKDVAALLEGSLRAGDIASRMGGDEFLLWLDRADTAGAQSVAGRILEGIAHLASGLPVLPRQLGASIGLAKAGNGEMLANLMKRADETMYHAKHGGKGRVSVAG